jgi:G3E family GTPase
LSPQEVLEEEQVGFSDRILLPKTDLVSAEEARALEPRLRRMNPRAPSPQSLEIEPDFLTDLDRAHDDDVTSFVFRTERAFDAKRLEDFFGAILRIHGANMMRYKGVIAMEGGDRRVVLAGRGR